MASALPPFPSFDPNPGLGAPGTHWTKYVARFKKLIVALDVTNTTRQKALLLHFAGQEVSDYLVETSTPNALKLEDIQSATQRDQTLQAVTEAIQTGDWHKPGNYLGQEAKMHLTS